MKKNSKGFFLAEAIVVIALVTTVMAFVYPNISKLYDTYKNRTMYYDQTEDLYALRAIYDYYSSFEITDNKNKIAVYTKGTGAASDENNKCSGSEVGGRIFGESNDGVANDMDKIGNWYMGTPYENNEILYPEKLMKTRNNYYLSELYITSYMATPSDNSYNFNKYLKTLKKTTFDKSSYRLIGVFQEKGTKKKYASIKIDNPNPDRGCNF